MAENPAFSLTAASLVEGAAVAEAGAFALTPFAAVALTAAVAVANVAEPDPAACLFCFLSQSSLLSLFCC